MWAAQSLQTPATLQGQSVPKSFIMMGAFCGMAQYPLSLAKVPTTLWGEP